MEDMSRTDTPAPQLSHKMNLFLVQYLPVSVVDCLSAKLNRVWYAHINIHIHMRQPGKYKYARLVV